MTISIWRGGQSLRSLVPPNLNNSSPKILSYYLYTEINDRILFIINVMIAVNMN